MIQYWQVLLPSSVGSSLLQQGASVNGAPFFHVQMPSGASTHVGVLSYEAAEGTIALPPKVVRRCVTYSCNRFALRCVVIMYPLSQISPVGTNCSHPLSNLAAILCAKSPCCLEAF